MEPTEPMEWETVIYAGVEVQAMNFLDGVIVCIDNEQTQAGGDVFAYPGWYVQKQRGDMDGPALWRREEKAKELAIRMVEV